MRYKFLITIVLGLFPCLANAQSADSVEAVKKAVPYLKADGQKWMDKRGCVSCHQVPMMLWSLNAIGETDDCSGEDLARWNAWSTQAVNFVKPAQKESHDEQETLSANIDTMAGLLLAIPGESDAPWRGKFVAKLCEEQAEDGSWKPCGQLPAQKRAALETRQVTTLWVTLALMRHGSDDFNQTAAIEFAGSAEDAESTERIAVELLVAIESNDVERAASLRTQLIDTQREDGGWGWLIKAPSDAYATGLALYALSQCDNPDPASIANAREFLIRTQLPTGSWKVPGTKKNAKGKPTPTANYWGTAWAVVGLLSTS